MSDSTLTAPIKPYHVTLTRNAKGRYQWEISVHGDDPAVVYNVSVTLDTDLRKQYKGQMAGEAESP